jgi:hypothetical protein
MKNFKVEIWVIQSYHLTVEAEDADAAENAAHSTLQEMSAEDAGAAYGDSWQDVMNAEEMTP